MERTSRQTLVAALPHGYDARRTADAVTAALARQPRHLVRTLTWDQGRELARWADIETALDVKGQALPVDASQLSIDAVG